MGLRALWRSGCGGQFTASLVSLFVCLPIFLSYQSTVERSAIDYGNVAYIEEASSLAIAGALMFATRSVRRTTVGALLG